MAVFSDKDYQGITDWFQHDDTGKQMMQNMQNQQTPDLSKMPKDMQFVIKCTAGLMYDTPVLLSSTSESDIGEPTITSMGTVFTVHSNKNLPIFATAKDIAGKIQVIPSHMMGIPKEMHTDQFVEFTLSNGYGLQAADGLQIMDWKGEYVPVSSLHVGDKVTIFEFSETAGVVQTDATITMVNSKKSLSRPVYLFMSEHENMLLPYVQQNGTIQLIPIKQ